MGVILVTGASRGIGRGIAVELARIGFDLAIHYNGNRDAALETVRLCREARETPAGNTADGPAELDVFQANIGESADRKRLVAEVLERFGTVDGLVNNAGIAPRKRDDIVYAEEEVFDEVLKVNLYGPYFLTQLLAQHWLRPDQDQAATAKIRGRIVFVTSVSAEMASVQRGEYCVSKAGLAMTSQLFAARLAGDGVLVYEVRPGIIATDMTAGVHGKYDSLIADGLVPQKRWGFPQDIGATIGAVMSGSLDFCPGTVINADGGLHLPRL